jgi:hypothetical protein
VLQSIVLLPNYSFCHFLPTFYHYLSLTVLLFCNLSPNYPTLLHTHHLLTSLLYQLYATPTRAIPDTSTLHYKRNIPKYTQGPKTQKTLYIIPHSSTPLPAPLLVPPSPTYQISIFNVTNITPQLSLFIYNITKGSFI